MLFRSNLKKSQMIVRAFDGTKREVLGNIKLSIQVGPCTFDFEFIVMDINPSYNCLFRNAMDSHGWCSLPTLHQKLKFMVKESLITVVVEKDMIATTTIASPTLRLKRTLLSAPLDYLK